MRFEAYEAAIYLHARLLSTLLMIPFCWSFLLFFFLFLFLSLFQAIIMVAEQFLCACVSA